jgi:hypothetical protein
LNNYLLIAIKESKKRLYPAIQRQKSLHPHREKVISLVRVLSPLINIPFKLNSKYLLFIDGRIIRNTKTGTAYYEISDVSIPKQHIWHRDVKPNFLIVKMIRIIFRLPWILGLFIRHFKIIKRWDLMAIQVFIGYEAYKTFFKKHPNLIPVIISDVSPTLHMQWSGALAAGNKIMWWQDDYHHFKAFLQKTTYPINAIMLWF